MPLQFVSPLAELLDQLAANGEALIGETSDAVSAAGLSAASAQQVCDLVGEAWPIHIEDSAGNLTAREHIDPAFAPFRLVLTKPPAGDREIRILTVTGLRQALSRTDTPRTIKHARSENRFETMGFRVANWDDQVEDFVAEAELRSPRELVKETAQARIVPIDIRLWLLKSAAPTGVDPVYKAWAEMAVQHLARSLASEVLPDGRLVLRGVVRLQINAPNGDTLERLNAGVFDAMQQAAAWVYENNREAETRLGLFINEMTRSAENNVHCADAYESCSDALEGARLAFQLGLEGLSKDTMKALSDLRKSLSDETAKLSDISRQFALAIASSIFLGMGVILTKDATKISGTGISLFAIVLIFYVIFVGYSGW